MRPCGPTLASPGLETLKAQLAEAMPATLLDASWPALEPVFAASPYLASLARRRPGALEQMLAARPEDTLAGILMQTRALDGGAEAMKRPLRQLKADLHLLTALADLGGVWDLEAVTAALSRFADATAEAALRAVAHDLRERGKLVAAADPDNPLPGLFGLAMGKHGALELNYSSDIDISLFYDPATLAGALAEGVEMQRTVDRAAQAFAALLTERTGDGYVFRVDLRLRPDPSSTPPVVAVPMALDYYEGVGQNWERAAFIKARVVLGDRAAGRDFLQALVPFVWRRSLDYQAILDVQSIKRQIHVHKTGEGLEAAGANLKLGRGGIREIEFYAQTQQLILGGRDPALRLPATLAALAALTRAGHVPEATRAALDEAYVRLRGLEHRVQMLADEQTHALPVEEDRRRAVAALAGEADLAAFDAGVEALLTRVNTLYGELFEGEEALSSDYGSLVFTGVENDPETLATLERMGFEEPAPVSDTIRSWHHGRIPATRSARGRELFTRLAPRLLEALAATGAPDQAFRRFAVFFSGLSAGVQIQALFLNQPALFELVVRVMAWAPRLARALGRDPAALDSMLDARFQTPLDADTGVADQMRAEAAAADDFEAAMDAVRRLHRDQRFRIGLQTLTGRADVEAAGRAYTVLADASIQALAQAALDEVTRQSGRIDGAVAVVALGKAGSREMTAASDLDLMTVHEAPAEALSEGRGLPPETWYGRFTQRLIAALSAHTSQGGLYEVDMRLRPWGAKGPLSVKLARLDSYYGDEADTWEFMVLTRARVVWASDPAFGERVGAAIEAVIRAHGRTTDTLARDVRTMRDRMMRDRSPGGFWDLKRVAGGLIDAEFVAQYRQLKGAPDGGPLTVSTLGGLADDPELATAWKSQQGLAQIFACAFNEMPRPEDEPEGLQARVARAVGQVDMAGLKAHLEALRSEARARFEEVLPPVATES
ncbi:bifunctional [glutamine synthetase] adenylyltransferase/[glutamine synthetase]-adenylyl-L-tyrosine phosphorylase [Brevundimonas sp. A19_0]|uniref:bifunctional [glutamine synthetase] adenylyltransferase/[glutamine synthetase]-adenylyl-L-tyrosine phosphorylase n=1 Tax=Brevundimonas sp. A19_0 TaxID=2821087 RepID=UPI001AD9F67B|nr:bifunctional [glutamine synthetase] adenylyltransferase/[glutamine synthetase]-adenylyl-L-tyrosine phosphorylase [Brevundimonas sp. A19_0]MBO9502767.1 bifunctional [glutamine synthetase] adenylyltransferase/[glutamine synthetase]-adenylyl-L-tyrosine phosphorylase [Brevundimonas sp. A19_0]